MHKLLLGVFSIVFASGTEMEKVFNSDAIRHPEVPTQNIQGNNEWLDPGSIYINGKIPFRTMVHNLLTNLGKADSVVPKSFECAGYFEVPQVNLCYYGLSYFEALMDTAVLRNINFGDGRCAMKTPQIVLDKNTTLQKLAGVFPESVKASYDWMDMKNNRNYRLVRIKTMPTASDEWVLKFYQNKLLEVEYFIPC